MDKKIKDDKRENHTKRDESEKIGKNKTRIQRKIIQRFEIKPEEQHTLVEQKCEGLENTRGRRCMQGWNINKIKGGTYYMTHVETCLRNKTE